MIYFPNLFMVKNRARKNVEVSINIELSTKINLEPASILIT